MSELDWSKFRHVLPALSGKGQFSVQSQQMRETPTLLEWRIMPALIGFLNSPHSPVTHASMHAG